MQRQRLFEPTFEEEPFANFPVLAGCDDLLENFAESLPVLCFLLGVAMSDSPPEASACRISRLLIVKVSAVRVARYIVAGCANECSLSAAMQQRLLRYSHA